MHTIIDLIISAVMALGPSAVLIYMARKRLHLGWIVTTGLIFALSWSYASVFVVAPLSTTFYQSNCQATGTCNGQEGMGVFMFALIGSVLSGITLAVILLLRLFHIWKAKRALPPPT